VTGVGHETDFTIADFAADARAPTPTAAAELVSPLRAELLEHLAECARCLSRDTRRQLQYAMQALDALARRLIHPAARLRGLHKEVSYLGHRLTLALARHLESFRSRTEKLQIALAASIRKRAGRGYGITLDANGKVLTDATGSGQRA
jgi:exodeoxyribonuclease VII large subunit